MCATCGCGHDAGVRITTFGTPERPADRREQHEHEHGQGQGHEHEHGHAVSLEQRLLAKNDAQAQRNRQWLRGHGVGLLNLMSAPGSGKTTLLEQTIRAVGAELVLSVIEGDQESLLDGDRVRATGCPAVQINTGAGCHLDAQMMARGLAELAPPPASLVIVENVGNLVCPALFDLGESTRVVVTAVTEGADKPVKYPQMFRAADLVLLNKIDLLPYLDVNLEQFTANVGLVNPRTRVLPISATRGEGMLAWFDHLRRLVPRPATFLR